MKVNWVLADSLVLDPMADLDAMKNCGSLWGSWRTWRSCQTDNVICHNMAKADELIKRSFNTVSNFYIPESVYVSLNRPESVNLYKGDFVHDVDQQEEIVAMHLALAGSDIILLLGFDLTEPVKNPDRLAEHRAHNYRQLVRQVIAANEQIQWVLVDHPGPIMKEMSSLENLSQDSLGNVLRLLAT